MRVLALRLQTYALAPLSAFAADLAARQGRVDEALRWVAREGRHFEQNAMPMFYVPGLAFVRILLVGGTGENLCAAETWLEQQTNMALQLHNTYAQIQCHVLAAVLYDTQGKRPEAVLALGRALAQAEQGQLVRVFVDLARELAPVFDALAADQPLAEFAAGVHRALLLESRPPTNFQPSLPFEAVDAAAPTQESGAGSSSQQALQNGLSTGHAAGQGVDGRDLRELLTYREMDVLRLLEQRLTNKEIAHSLGISTETVRQHTVNLFRKLNVDNRRQAIVATRNRGYFEERR